MNQKKEHGEGRRKTHRTPRPYVKVSCQSKALWKGIMSVKGIFWVSLKFKLGNGQEVNFWKDRWLGVGRIKELVPPLYRVDRK